MQQGVGPGETPGCRARDPRGAGVERKAAPAAAPGRGSGWASRGRGQILRIRSAPSCGVSLPARIVRHGQRVLGVRPRFPARVSPASVRRRTLVRISPPMPGLAFRRGDCRPPPASYSRADIAANARPRFPARRLPAASGVVLSCGYHRQCPASLSGAEIAGRLRRRTLVRISPPMPGPAFRRGDCRPPPASYSRADIAANARPRFPARRPPNGVPFRAAPVTP